MLLNNSVTIYSWQMTNSYRTEDEKKRKIDCTVCIFPFISSDDEALHRHCTALHCIKKNCQ